MKDLYFTILFILILPLSVISQVRISGKVVSASDNNPIAGASIRLKGTNQVSVSSEGGLFNLILPDSTVTLIVTSIGFHPSELKSPLPSPLIIELEEEIGQLETVMVSTGYEIIPKERATGSFTHIDNELFNRSADNNILNRLKGITNGLSFDERRPHSPRIHIRGLSTIYADQSPLIVVNNFPYEGNIANINPNDVENITVLKDAAAASIWGVRAANGVIVITTKQGNLNQTEQISFNSSVAITSKPNLDYLPFMSSREFIEVEEFLFKKGFYTAQEANPNHPPLSPVVELLIQERDGNISADQLRDKIDRLKNVNVKDDFEKFLYQPAINQQYLLNLQGGSSKLAYYLSAGYDRGVSNLDDQVSRLSLRSSNTFSPNEKLQIHADLAYIQSKHTTGRPGFSDITTGAGKLLYPYAQLADETDTPLPIVKDYRHSFALQGPENGLLNWEYVPLQDYLHSDNSTYDREILLNVGVDLHITDYLTFQSKYRYNQSLGKTLNGYGMDSYYTRDLINRFTQVAADASLAYPVPVGSILDESSSESTSQALRGQLRYHKSWHDHRLDAIAGGELREHDYTSNAHRTYGYDENVLTSSVVNYLVEYPMYYNQNQTATIPYRTDYSGKLDRYTSLYANGAYTYRNRYTVSGSMRKDASNLFGVNTNQRGVPLWSAGISWSIHRESFYRLSWMDYLKLRLTYGYNGNLDQNTTAVTTILQLTDYQTNRPYARVRTYPNPDLRWEKVKTVNIGLDFSLGGRIDGSLEYYIKDGMDLLGDAPIDPTVGLISGVIRRNLASTSGQGVDLEITSANIDRLFKWHTTLIFNYNTSKVTNLDSISTNGSYYVNSGLNIIPIKGKPLYNVFSYQWKGLDHETGDPIGYVNNQSTTDYRSIVRDTPVSDLVFHGPALPTGSGALINTLTYKGFMLSTNLTYRFGYYFRRSSISYGNMFNLWNGHSDFTNRWQKPGDENRTSVPSMVYPNNGRRDEFYTNSAELVEKGDHIRLQDVNLSYTIDRGHQAGLPVRKLRIFLNGQNLGILWRANKHNLDPDYASGFLPPSFSLSFGLQANF